MHKFHKNLSPNPRKFKNNRTNENFEIYLKKAEPKHGKLSEKITEIHGKNCWAKINLNAKTKQLWDTIRRITDETRKDPIKHLICNKNKITKNYRHSKEAK